MLEIREIRFRTEQKKGVDVATPPFFFSTTYLHSDPSSRMDPPTERPTTRAKNANQHPGMIGQTRKRRTKAEIARDEALLLAKKEAEKKRKDEGIARVAQMEDKMAINDANVRSAHPRSRKGI